MQILSTLLVLSSAASVLAAPRFVDHKRAFSVSQVRNEQFRGRNGRAALHKAYNKYSIKLAASGGNDGTVPAVPEEYDIEYLCEVDIAGQIMKLDFDTGSSDLWVFSDLQPANETQGRTIFQTKGGNDSFSIQQGSTWDISYADGSGASGVVGTATVKVGGTTVEDMAVEAATQVSDQFLQDANNGGLLGLAFPKLNTVQPKAAVPFFFRAMDSLSEPVFAVTLKHQAEGSYDFGTIDKSKYEGEISYTDVNAENGFWEFTSAGYKLANGTGGSSQKTIADSGTTLLLMTDDAVEAYYATVDGAKLDEEQGGYTFPCSTNVPGFAVEVGNGYYAEIPGEHMNYAPIQEGSDTCFGALQSNSGAEFQIFGDVVFKSQFVVHNGKENKLGWAPQAGAGGSTTRL